MFKLLNSLLFAVLFTSSYAVSAADKIVGGLKIESLAIISEWGAHQAGNLEISFENGFSLPDEFSCHDRKYVTTLKTIEGFEHIVAVAMAAIATNRHVQIGFTDDADRMAYPGRCSIKAIIMHN